MSLSRLFTVPFCLLVALGALGLRSVAAAQAAGPDSPRQHLLLDDDWRFFKGDPNAGAAALIYDVRPKVTDTRDGIAADSKPKEAEKVAERGTPVLKAWILPTANPFIAEPALRHVRPAGDPGADVACLRADFDDSGWQRVELPHDWAIAGPFIEKGDVGGMGRLPSWGSAWYRRKLDLPSGDAGKSVFLEIEGAMSYASVWLNGHLVGGWPYGYASWQVNLTPYVRFGGVNQLAIRLDNPPSSSRWYPGGGLFRNVWLTVTSPVHVGQWGTRVVCSDVSAASAKVSLGVTIDNDAASGVARAEVTTALFAAQPDGRPLGVPVAVFAPRSADVAAGSSAEVDASLTLSHPNLWGPPPTQAPNRYVAVSTISVDGRVVDRVETPFGIRSLRFDADHGLFVNGEHVVIKGVNLHHDLGALGAAFNVAAARRQLELLREAGCNAIRTSHNPPAPELLELADRMGFLVLDEIFDCWDRLKTPLDFHLIFPDWHEADLRAFIRRDRNHPSVFLWSVGNEVGEQYTGAAGAAVARELVGIAHQEDPTRLVTCAMNFAGPTMPLPAEVDVIGLNYQGEGIRDLPEFAGTDRIRKPPQYDAFHRKFPGKVILSTETASAFSSRGVYLFPVDAGFSSPVRDGRGGDSRIHQVSAYELYAVDFGSSADKTFSALDAHPYVAGQFVWSGFDYLGEPTPYYTARSSYCGIFDLAGLKKDRFYLYQSYWRPNYPMAHLLPHWTWPGREGKVTPVHVFTTGDEAELFLNGRSLGRRRKEHGTYRIRWDNVVYEPGTLRVVAYRNGKPWAEDSVSTAGPAAGLALLPDRTALTDDGRDLVFVTVRVVDRQGRLVPTASPALRFKVGGAGEFVASDNGDPTNFEPFPLPTRHAFSGKCVVIIRARRGETGPVTLEVSAEGMPSAELTLSAVNAAP